MLVIERLGLSKYFVLLLFSILITSKSYSEEYPDSTVNILLKKGIDLIILQQYKDAREVFLSLNKEYPQLPLGNIYLAAVEIAKTYDYAENVDSDSIKKYLTEAENQSLSLISENKNDIWYQYFYALANGYFAYYEALNKNWITAINYGLNSVAGFEKCLKIIPNFYEAYIALGTFKYWKRRKTEFLDWLPFVSNNENEGIELLDSAVSHSSYNTYLAINSLIWIYIDKKQPRMAVKLAEKALKIYPNSRFFMWGLARAFEDLDKNKAISVYKKILNSYLNITGINRYNEILLKYIIAKLYFQTGQKSESLQFCNEILSIQNISVEVKDRLKNHFEKVKYLRKELIK